MSFITLIIALIVELTMSTILTTNEFSYTGDGKGEHPTSSTQEEREQDRSEESAQLREELSSLEKTVVTEHATWIGQLTEPRYSEEYGRQVFDYRITRVTNDTEDENTLHFLRNLTIYSTVDWNVESTQEDDLLIVTEWQGGGEGGSIYTTYYKNESLLLSSEVTGYGPFVQEFSITAPTGRTYQVSAVTKDVCELNAIYPPEYSGEYQETKGLTDVKNIILTETGSTISFQFPPAQPLTVPLCYNIDGGWYTNVFLSSMITTDINGVHINLTDKITATISFSDSGEPQVTYKKRQSS